MKILTIIISISILSSSTSTSSTKFPVSNNCEAFIYSSNPKKVWFCPPGLHFSPTKHKCMQPAEARCQEDYWCPTVDDPRSPVFIADAEDCRIYYQCSNGIPIKKSCPYGQWWDIISSRCNSNAKLVICDKRTIYNPSTKSYSSQLSLESKIEVCNIKKDLFDGPNYLKSVCIVSASFAYDAALKKCAENNMNLFIIDDETVEAHFYDAIMNLVAVNHPRGAVWINGKRESHAMDFDVYDANETMIGPLYDGVDFYSKYAVGDCLKYTGIYGPYQALPAPCTDATWAICEHYKQTETHPHADLAGCTHKRDLITNGVYLKSVCVVSTAFTYDDGRRHCSKLGMNLFAIDSEAVEEEFHRSCEDLLKTWAGGHLWINGMRDLITNQWNVFNANRTIQGQLYKDIEWVNKDTIRGKTSGECLRYSGQYGPYQALGVACTEKSWIVCEHFD